MIYHRCAGEWTNYETDNGTINPKLSLELCRTPATFPTSDFRWTCERHLKPMERFLAYERAADKWITKKG